MVVPHCDHEPHKQQAGPNSGVRMSRTQTVGKSKAPIQPVKHCCLVMGFGAGSYGWSTTVKAALAATQPSENNSNNRRTCQPDAKWLACKNTGHQTLAQQRDVFTQIMRRKQGDHDVRGEFSNRHESGFSDGPWQCRRRRAPVCRHSATSLL